MYQVSRREKYITVDFSIFFWISRMRQMIKKLLYVGVVNRSDRAGTGNLFSQNVHNIF